MRITIQNIQKFYLLSICYYGIRVLVFSSSSLPLFFSLLITMADESSNTGATSANQLVTVPQNPSVILNLPISTKLTRSNYLACQCQITPLLHGYGLYKFIDIESPTPSPTIITTFGQIEVNPEYIAWHKQNQILLGWLRFSLSESLLGQTSFSTTAATLWDYLQKSFSVVSRARLSELSQASNND
jgi:hypothetical protein